MRKTLFIGSLKSSNVSLGRFARGMNIGSELVVDGSVAGFVSRSGLGLFISASTLASFPFDDRA